MIDLPDVPYVKGFPQIVRSTSVSRAGKRALSFVEYADPFWQANVETATLDSAKARLTQAFIDEAGSGTKTVLFALRKFPVPQAYEDDPTNAALSNAGSLVSVTDGFTLAIGSVDNGLDLRRGDMISLKSGDYRSLHRVMTGAVAASNAISLVVEPHVPTYIAPGAVVKFRELELNMRVLPGSGTITDDYLPVASFTLVEVAK